MLDRRFKHAVQGLHVLLAKDNKFWLHILCAAIVIFISIILKIDRIEWMFIITSIALVLAFEAINTAIEYTVDLVTEEYHDYAKFAKDIGAMSVLIVSILAVIVGLIIFIPHLIQWL